MFDTVLFDLDGTLTNPLKGITGGVLYALKRLSYALRFFVVLEAERNLKVTRRNIYAAIYLKLKSCLIAAEHSR